MRFDMTYKHIYVIDVNRNTCTMFFLANETHIYSTYTMYMYMYVPTYQNV